MRRMLIRMSFAAVEGVAGFEPPGPVLETGSVATSLTPRALKMSLLNSPNTKSILLMNFLVLQHSLWSVRQDSNLRTLRS